MRLYVYIGASRDAIVIETNMVWAVPYWAERKRRNPRIVVRTEKR